MENNRIRLSQESVDLRFKFSDIVGLRWDQQGTFAQVDALNQTLNIPISPKAFADAAQYMAENIPFCDKCGRMLQRVQVSFGGYRMPDSFECPKCSKSC